MRQEPEDLCDIMDRLQRKQSNPAVLYRKDGSRRKMDVSGAPSYVTEPRLIPLTRTDILVSSAGEPYLPRRFEILIHDLEGAVDEVLIYVQRKDF